MESNHRLAGRTSAFCPLNYRGNKSVASVSTRREDSESGLLTLRAYIVVFHDVVALHHAVLRTSGSFCWYTVQIQVYTHAVLLAEEKRAIRVFELDEETATLLVLTVGEDDFSGLLLLRVQVKLHVPTLPLMLPTGDRVDKGVCLHKDGNTSMDMGTATADISDTQERFLEVWRKFRDNLIDFYEGEDSYFPEDTLPEEQDKYYVEYNKTLHGDVFSSYDSLTRYVRRQYESFDENLKRKEQDAIDDALQNDSWVYDEMELDMAVHNDIMQNAEEYHRDGWSLTEPLLEKMVRENLRHEKHREAERPKFTSDDWRKGWLILRYLDSKTTGGTKADQLLWLRNALVYNDTFNIFATKEAYGRGMEYERRLSSTFPKNERIVVGPWGGK